MQERSLDYNSKVQALTFFAQTENIKLVLPQAVQSMFFYIGKSVVSHLCEGPDEGPTPDRIE